MLLIELMNHKNYLFLLFSLAELTSFFVLPLQYTPLMALLPITFPYFPTSFSFQILVQISLCIAVSLI